MRDIIRADPSGSFVYAIGKRGRSAGIRRNVRHAIRNGQARVQELQRLRAERENRRREAPSQNHTTLQTPRKMGSVLILRCNDGALTYTGPCFPLPIELESRQTWPSSKKHTAA